MSRFARIVFAAALAAACTHSDRSTYDPRDVGRTTETATGVVVASRIVDIRGETSNAGVLAGGALGGAGSGLAFENSWAAMLGAVFGAGAGYLTERSINARQGIEYLVDLEDGRTITIVQNREGGEAALADGTAVLVQLGGKYARVVPDPRGGRAEPRRDGRTDSSDADRDLPPPPPPTADPSHQHSNPPAARTQVDPLNDTGDPFVQSESAPKRGSSRSF